MPIATLEYKNLSTMQHLSDLLLSTAKFIIDANARNINAKIYFGIEIHGSYAVLYINEPHNSFSQKYIIIDEEYAIESIAVFKDQVMGILDFQNSEVWE